MAALGLGLLLIGFGFKVAAVPFHMWAPDVYDGSPTPVTGFMATGVKAAAFVALVRVLMEAFPRPSTLWQPIVAGARRSRRWWSATWWPWRSARSSGCWPTARSRTRATCSSASGPGRRPGAGAVLLYLLAYSLTTLAAFGILAALGRGGERDGDARRHRRARRHASRHGVRAQRVCMLSLLGFPGTFGFIGKWYIISAVVAAGQYILPVILVLDERRVARATICRSSWRCT